MSTERSFCTYCGETSVTIETMVHESDEQFGVYDRVTFYGLCQACRHFGPDCTTKSGAILAFRSAMEVKKEREERRRVEAMGCVKCRLVGLADGKRNR